MADTAPTYVATGDELVDRMIATFEASPEAADVDDVFKLFKFEAFKINDLDPTFAQAVVCFGKPRTIWRERQKATADV